VDEGRPELRDLIGETADIAACIEHGLAGIIDLASERSLTGGSLIWFGLSLGPVSISNGLELLSGLKSAQIDLSSVPDTAKRAF
jgi:hypothetical protein